MRGRGGGALRLKPWALAGGVGSAAAASAPLRNPLGAAAGSGASYCRLPTRGATSRTTYTALYFAGSCTLPAPTELRCPFVLFLSIERLRASSENSAMHRSISRWILSWYSRGSTIGIERGIPCPSIPSHDAFGALASTVRCAQSTARTRACRLSSPNIVAFSSRSRPLIVTLHAHSVAPDADRTGTPTSTRIFLAERGDSRSSRVANIISVTTCSSSSKSLYTRLRQRRQPTNIAPS